MSQACSVCGHPQLRAVNAALRRGASVRDIAARFALSKSAVGRHEVAHVAPAQPKGPTAAPADPKRAPGTKTYRCPRYPNFAIGAAIVFKDGVYTTADPHLQHLVEINSWYGKSVFLDGVEHLPWAPRAPR